MLSAAIQTPSSTKLTVSFALKPIINIYHIESSFTHSYNKFQWCFLQLS